MDFAVTSGLRSDTVVQSAADGSTAVTQYAAFKCSYERTRQQCQDAGIDFCPVVVEAHSGALEKGARIVLHRIAKQACPEESELAIHQAVERTTQHVSIILQRENARAVLRRLAAAIGGTQLAQMQAELHL